MFTISEGILPRIIPPFYAIYIWAWRILGFRFLERESHFSRRTQHHAAQAQHMRKGHLGKSSVVSSVADKYRF